MRLTQFNPDPALDPRTNKWLEEPRSLIYKTQAFHCGSWEFVTKAVDKAWGYIYITGSAGATDVVIPYPCRVTGISVSIDGGLSGVETISVSPTINSVRQDTLTATLDVDNPGEAYATPNNASDETILSLNAGDTLGVSLYHADLGGLYIVNVTVFTI